MESATINISKESYKKMNSDHSLKVFFDINHIGFIMGTVKKYFNLGNPTLFGWNKYAVDTIGKDQLNKIASEISSKGYDLKDAKQFTYYRAIGQTWNGYIAEYTVKKEIKSRYGITVNEVSKDKDQRYSVDLECDLFGIQVKPQSYKGSNPSLDKDKERNLKNNNDYTLKFNRPVFYVYWGVDGLEFDSGLNNYNKQFFISKPEKHSVCFHLSYLNTLRNTILKTIEKLSKGKFQQVERIKTENSFLEKIENSISVYKKLA